MLITPINEANTELLLPGPAFARKEKGQLPQLSQGPHSTGEVPPAPLMTLTAQPGTPGWDLTTLTPTHLALPLPVHACVFPAESLSYRRSHPSNLNFVCNFDFPHLCTVILTVLSQQNKPSLGQQKSLQ